MKELVKKGLKILVIFTKGNEKDRYTRTSIYTFLVISQNGSLCYNYNKKAWVYL